ncbi:MAG: amidohydrolase family protein [Acidimicrobiia bacterium]|nr:amidohydrolase family protein [Acidimicrobiia bacterium]
MLAADMHDADAHIVEPPDWLVPYADPSTRPRLESYYDKDWAGHRKFLDDAIHKHADPEYRAKDAEEIWLRKNYWATGSFLKEDRSQALDLLGFKSQLIFNSSHMKELHAAEHGDDLDYAYGIARAHNRAVVDFCSVDRRLLPVGYVPLADFERARQMAREALDMGCKALLIASACPRGHSPSHVALDPVWAQAQEAGIPVVLHVGGGGRLLDPAYFENGLPPVPDFHGGDGNFRSVDYMAICYPPMQTLAVLIIDGVLDRFPRLKLGAIELGASWVPGWMHNMDSAADAFRKNEERLQKLELKPSEYVHRQIRVTPYPHEDAGWIVQNTGEEICLFSSDYPHVEGGRNPLGRFERSLAGVTDSAKQAFYHDNFVDLMGHALDTLATAA